MKMIKVDDDIHAELKKADKSINRTLRDLVFGTKRADLDIVLDQVRQMFDLLVEMNAKLDSPQNNFSENSGDFNLPPPRIDTETTIIEPDWVKERRRREEMLDAQKHYALNPEDEAQ